MSSRFSELFWFLPPWPWYQDLKYFSKATSLCKCSWILVMDMFFKLFRFQLWHLSNKSTPGFRLLGSLVHLCTWIFLRYWPKAFKDFRRHFQSPLSKSHSSISNSLKWLLHVSAWEPSISRTPLCYYVLFKQSKRYKELLRLSRESSLKQPTPLFQLICSQ